MNGTALLTGIPQPDGLKPIQFVVKDVDRLRDTLKDTFGFKRIEELKGGIEKSDFEKKLDDVIKDVKDNGRQFLLIAISTHGKEGSTGDHNDGDLYEHYLNFSDGVMPTQEILNKLDKLEEVTKIVLISACRSRRGRGLDNVDQGVPIEVVADAELEYTNLPTPATASAGNPSQIHVSPNRLPNNCVLWFASASGYFAYGGIQNETIGSFFITTLCEELNKIKPSHKKSIIDIMCQTHQRLASKEKQSVKFPAGEIEYKTIPCFIHTLRNSFDFEGRSTEPSS